MPKAIRADSENNRTTGFALPGLYSGKPGTVIQQVHDGDTINVMPKGNIGVRLLGIDTPEVSYVYPGPKFMFVDLKDARWNEFLKTPFDNRWGTLKVTFSDSLKSFIQSKVTGEPGTSHDHHAQRATDRFREMVSQDMKVMGQDLASFSYYLRFGFEIMDGYGRFLCTINRNQPKQDVPEPRAPTYNMRLLEEGLAFPYFIWPNINPWDRPDSVAKSVIPPGKAKNMAENDSELVMARTRVQQARERHLGVFNMTSPLLLEPFELRYLSRRDLPSRYVIDLTSDSNHLIHPGNYFSIPHPEDRLWIPAVYVPLFEKAGWKTISDHSQ